MSCKIVSQALKEKVTEIRGLLYKLNLNVLDVLLTKFQVNIAHVEYN